MPTQQPVQGNQVVLRRQVKAAAYGYGDYYPVIEIFLIAEVLASESGISVKLISELDPSQSIKVDSSEIELVPDNLFN